MSSQESDSALIEACRGGSESAWRRLTDRYQNLVYSTALNTGLPREHCVDVYQQVWLELYRSLHRLQNPQGVAKWLIVTTRRLSYRMAVRQDLPIDEVAADLVDTTAAADERIEALQQRMRLQSAMQGLGGRCRSLLDMLFLQEGRPSYRRIAATLGVAVGSIGSLRARCLEQLRGLLEASS